MYGKREMRYIQAARRYNSEARVRSFAATASSPCAVNLSAVGKKASV